MSMVWLAAGTRSGARSEREAVHVCWELICCGTGAGSHVDRLAGADQEERHRPDGGEPAPPLRGDDEEHDLSFGPMRVGPAPTAIDSHRAAHDSLRRRSAQGSAARAAGRTRRTWCRRIDWVRVEVQGLTMHVRERLDHRFAQRHMSDFVDGALSARRRRRVERHADVCRECGPLRRALVRLVAELRMLRDPSAGQPSVAPLVVARIRGCTDGAARSKRSCL